MNRSGNQRLVTALFCLTLAPAATAQHRFSSSETVAVQTFLEDNFADADAAMVIGIIDTQGSRVFSAGSLDNGTDQKVSGDTIFEIGSVTKTMTTLLLLDMGQRGDIEPLDPVAKHLPEYARVPTRRGKEITLLHLAAQDSGLPFNPDNMADEFWVDAYNRYTVEDMYAFLGSYELPMDPGDRFEYSNIGFTLLGHVLERKSGFDFESLVKSRICEPLGMDSTMITLTPDLASRVAMGHGGEGQRAPRYKLQAFAPAGALLSSANDLLKYVSANLALTQTNLTPLMKKMQVLRHEGSAKFGRTAMPWVDEGVYQPPGSELWGHAGGSPGCSAFIGFDTKKRRGVVVQTTQKAIRPAAIGWRILQGMPLTTDNVAVRQLVGIGTSLDSDLATGLLRITRVFPESAASQAGLSAGWLVRRVNGVSVEGKSPLECIEMMNGPEGTKVLLEVLDPSGEDSKSVELRKQKFLTLSG